MSYKEENVTAVLIECMAHWTDIVRGSFQPIMVPVKYDDDGNVTVKMPGIEVVDKFTNDKIFFWSEALKAVRHSEEDHPTINQTEDHRLLP